MTVFWDILAVLALAAAGLAAYLVRVFVLALVREPVWHPGDDLPDVPEDSPIRQQRG